ncbi:MAG: hypothetical protein B7Z15_14610 [Rhizobiales bacterium 32-66-8]|nr:MAG: hypothetical protein B7Z15_14610 [Rhizobiales bacterium 32-66-8]
MSTPIASGNFMSSIQPAPDQHYLAQLTRGFRHLRFVTALELEYRKTLADEQRRAALACAAMALVIWLGFAISDIFRVRAASPGSIALDLWVVLIGRWTLLVLLAAFCLSPLRWRVSLQHSAFVIYSLIGIVSAVNGIIYKANGIPSADNALVVVVMSAFLPLGLTLSRALAAALLLVIATALAGLIALPSNQLASHLGLTLVMAIAMAVGAAGGYLREYAHRRQFLLTAILSRQAQFDPLTDLANRRLFQRHAEAAIAHAARHDEPLVLAILDIDHFKSFNDSFGHAAGDQALCEVAEVIRAAARRPMDLAARVGGEEFALLLYGCDIARAEPVLAALRQQVAAIRFDRPGAQPLTVSIGATSPEPGEALSQVYARADGLLYGSKSDGRDRVSIG